MARQNVSTRDRKVPGTERWDKTSGTDVPGQNVSGPLELTALKPDNVKRHHTKICKINSFINIKFYHK